MNAYASPGNPSEQFGRRLEDFFQMIGSEFRQSVAYIDRVVVPEVRHEAGHAARVLATHLEQLADRLDPMHSTDAQNRTQGQ